MNKQTKIQIACVLSDIFLTSALRYNDNGEIDKDLTKAYYTRITDKVLSIYPNFSKNDLDSIFPAIIVCIKQTFGYFMMIGASLIKKKCEKN